MRLNRFFVDFKIDDNSITVVDADFLNQVRNVLRMVPGDKIVLSDGFGNEILSKVVSYSQNKVLLEKLEEYKNDNEPLKKITLYCAILKNDNFEIVAQKAVEVGATKIVPIISSRTVKTNIRLERLSKIIKEAAEQSGRSMIPVISDILNFDEALKAAESNDANIIFHVSSGDLLVDVGDNINVGVFIGPEGGWDDEEVAKARDRGFKVLSLGRLTLRAETAAIVATYVLAK